MSSKKVQVLLADGHPLIRIGIRTSLADEGDILIVGEATNGQAAQEMSLDLHPDIVLLDLNMPGPSAQQTVAYLKQHCPKIKIVLLTAYDDETYVRSLMAIGIAGYVLKDEAPEVLVQAIRAVMSGVQWLSRGILETLTRPKVDNEIIQPEKAGLTQREWEVLEMIAQGLDNSHIAAKLHLSQQTVRNYVSRIYNKLGVRSRGEAVVWGIKCGLGEK